MSVYAGPTITNSGLSLALDAANLRSYPTSGTVWSDLSGNNRNGTITNAIFASGNNGSIYFDGTGDYTTITNCTALKWQNINAVTTELIFKTSGRYTGNSRQYVFDSRGSNGSPYYCWYLSSIIDSNSYFTMSVGKSTSNSYTDCIINTPSTMINNIWITHQTVDKTITTNNVKIYINGNLVDTKSFDFSSPQGTDSTDNMYIGTYFGSADGTTDFHFLGNFYSVKLYNRALSAAEINQNFNALRGRFGL